MLLLAAATTAGAAQPNLARDQVTTPSPISDHFALRGSYSFGSVSTDARIDDTAAGVEGTAFSAEDDFGLSDRARQGRGEIMIRLRQRGRLRIDALNLSRSASQRLTRTLRYGRQTFTANERVDTNIDWNEFSLTGTYSFLRNDRYELGLGLGLHLVQTQAVAAVPARAVRESFDGSGPLATLAIDGTWRLSRRFAWSLRAQALDLTVQDISGRVVDWHSDVQFRWHPNVAFGVGYQSNYVRADLPRENPGGTFRFEVAGPELFVRVSF